MVNFIFVWNWIIYNKTFPTFWSPVTDLLQGKWKKNFTKCQDINKTLIKSSKLVSFFLFARVKCKYSLGSSAPSSRLRGSLEQLISQASRIFVLTGFVEIIREIKTNMNVSLLKISMLVLIACPRDAITVMFYRIHTNLSKKIACFLTLGTKPI